MKYSFTAPMAMAIVFAGCAGPTRRDPAEPLRGVLLPSGEVLREGMTGARPSAPGASGFNAVVAAVGDETTGEEIEGLKAAAGRDGVPLYLWLNVGRNRRLADARPEWIGGMGSHEDWRRLFPAAPHPRKGERIGVYPWVPVRYRAVFEDRLAAIEKLLGGRAAGIEAVFLHGLQAPPSACGCGNGQCRWTVDYGMDGGPDTVAGHAPAAFLAALGRRVPGVRWIPVWVTECEADDQGEGGTGYCGDVHCYSGLCWQESTAELEAVTRELGAEDGEGPIALLLAEGAFRRSLPRYGGAGGWIAQAVALLATVPLTQGRTPVPPGRIIAVVEGAGPEERAAADRALAAGARGVIVARMPLDESWEPRIIPAAPVR